MSWPKATTHVKKKRRNRRKTQRRSNVQRRAAGPAFHFRGGCAIAMIRCVIAGTIPMLRAYVVS